MSSSKIIDNTNNKKNKKIVIIGGVAAGTSAASKAKRVDPNAQITILQDEPLVNVFRKSIDMDLLAEDGGELNLIIPRNILDSKQANGTDFRYIVEINDAQVESQETTIEEGDQLSIAGNNSSRVISIFVPPGSINLEIFGTKVL